MSLAQPGSVIGFNFHIPIYMTASKRLFPWIPWLAALAFLFSAAVSAKNKPDPDVERDITKLEQNWANAMVASDAAALDQLEASDFTYTGPDGKVTTKAEEQRDIKSGDLKITECKLSEIKVRVYGKTAVVSGVSQVKGTYKKEDIGGKFRFTDVLVRKKDKWQAVASLEVAIVPGK